MKTLRVAVTAFLVMGGLVFGSSAANATVDECIPIEAVDAWTEIIPAVTEQVNHPAEYTTVVVKEAVAFQPAVYATEYEFVHKNPNHPNSPRWEKEGWNADGNDNSKGWSSTGNTRKGELIKAEVPAQDAVTEQKLVKEAWTETKIVTPERTINHPAIEGVTCDDEEPPVVVTPQTKTLKWVLPNGGTPNNVTWPQPVFNSLEVPCGETVWLQVDVYPYTTDADKARTDALDDDGFLLHGEDHGWVKSWSFEEYSAPECELPTATPTTPVVTVGIEQCVDGESVDANSTITLVPFEGGTWENVGQDENGVLLDVAPGEYMFVAVANEGYQLAPVDGLDPEYWGMVFVTVPESVDVNCEVPPTEEPPTEEPPVVVPPVTTPEQPVKTIVKTVTAPVAAEQLAQTGVDFPVFPVALVAAVILGGGAWLLVMAHRRRNAEDTTSVE